MSCFLKEKQPYSFSWDVKDDETYNDFVHTEESDGKVISGSYRVELPDGRTQIVTYRADENGNVADVTYEGEAQYPEEAEYKAASYVSPAYAAPAYKAPAYAAPTYSAPAYKAPVYEAAQEYSTPIFRSAYKVQKAPAPVYPAAYPKY